MVEIGGVTPHCLAGVAISAGSVESISRLVNSLRNVRARGYTVIGKMANV